VNYELYMRGALSEARNAAARGERADGAVAVMDEAMVARAQEQTIALGDPTAHAVVAVLREAARRLGTRSLSGLTVFCTIEPCVMCVGALLESDADGLVFALPDPAHGAAGSVLQLCDGRSLPRRLAVVSGILQADAADLLAAPAVGASRNGATRG
jgi:tRNA(adenine34) deaminase